MVGVPAGGPKSRRSCHWVLGPRWWVQLDIETSRHFITNGQVLRRHSGTRGPLFDGGCFSLDIETFQLQRVCALENGISRPHPYSNFPPSLSSPRISTGIEEKMPGQGLELLRTEEPKDGNHSDSTAEYVDAGGQAGVSRIGDGGD